MEITLGDLVARLGGELVGDPALKVRQIAPLERAGEGELAFINSPKYLAGLADCRATAVIMSPKMADKTDKPRILIADPYLYFARVGRLFNPIQRPPLGAHPSAVVESELPASVSVGPNAVVGKNCVIGENTIIGPGCTIADGVHIGPDSLLHGGVRIYANTRIGARAILHAGAVIGSDGFGFAKDADKHWVKIPQIGRVVMGDDVEVGANTAIDRGALDDTVIGNGIKIDNLVHVAHNVHVGDDTLLIAQAGVAGSTHIGQRVILAGQTGVSGHLNIGDDVVVSAATSVMKSLPNPGLYTSTVPQMPHEDWVRNFAHLRRLDGLAKRVRELEKQLQKQLAEHNKDPQDPQEQS